MSPKTAPAADENSPAEVTLSRVTISVLGYQEDDEWVALALEMDLRGYGRTFKEALEELRDLVSTQIRFAQFKGQPDLVWKSAEPIWFERFADVRRERLNALVQDRTPADPSFDVAGLVIPQAGGSKPDFVPAEA